MRIWTTAREDDNSRWPAALEGFWSSGFVIYERHDFRIFSAKFWILYASLRLHSTSLTGESGLGRLQYGRPVAAPPARRMPQRALDQ